MTEQEWLTSDDARAMLEYAMYAVRVVTSGNPTIERRVAMVSDRKLRLACQAVLTLCGRGAFSEKYQPSPGSVMTRMWAEHCFSDSVTPGSLLGKYPEVANARADLLRHIVGNPWKPMLRWHAIGAEPWSDRLGWIDGRSWPQQIDDLAQVLYAEPDCGAEGPLHDALLEAGQEELARHFAEASHPRGCWALDLILGKE